MKDTRVVELLDWAAMLGLVLPMPAAAIVAIEAAGGVVDLVTGEVIEDGASLHVDLTVVGAALAVVLAYEGEATEP